MPLPPLLQAIVDYVRKGYPHGVPQQDYLPLFALLSRRLSEEEIEELGKELTSTAPDAQTPESVRAAIERLTNQPPSEAEVARVRELLRAGGWEPDEEPAA